MPGTNFYSLRDPSSTQVGVVKRQKNFFGGTQHPHSTPKDISIPAGEIPKFIKTNIKLKLTQKVCVLDNKAKSPPRPPLSFLTLKVTGNFERLQLGGSGI